MKISEVFTRSERWTCKLIRFIISIYSIHFSINASYNSGQYRIIIKLLSTRKLCHVLFPVHSTRLFAIWCTYSQFLFVWLWLDLFEGTHESFINAHYRSIIIKLSAIISGWKYGHKLPSCEKLISILLYLVTPCY